MAVNKRILSAYKDVCSIVIRWQQSVNLQHTLHFTPFKIKTCRTITGDRRSFNHLYLLLSPSLKLYSVPSLPLFPPHLLSSESPRCVAYRVTHKWHAGHLRANWSAGSRLDRLFKQLWQLAPTTWALACRSHTLSSLTPKCPDGHTNHPHQKKEQIKNTSRLAPTITNPQQRQV